MRNFWFMLIAIVVCGSVYSSDDDKKIQFLSGFVFLNSRTNMPDSTKAQRYLELQKITGISGAKAIAFIENFRGQPEKWKKIEDSMQKVINNSDTILKKK